LGIFAKILSQMNTFQILLASNSEAAEHMAEATRRLQMVFPKDIRFSEVLESCAVTKAGELSEEGGLYLNAICLANTELTLDWVQSVLKEMESEMGRKRMPDAKWVVAIDLDLVVWNGDIIRPWDVAQTFYKDCLISLQ
jgi:2-amino-4-hydroxy-6-hydroxymethyldihydropteridine diphosphokinase